MCQLVKLTILHNFPPKKKNKCRKDNNFLTLPPPGKVQQYLVCSTQKILQIHLIKNSFDTKNNVDFYRTMSMRKIPAEICCGVSST
jgi:hypothetical protein